MKKILVKGFFFWCVCGEVNLIKKKIAYKITFQVLANEK